MSYIWNNYRSDKVFFVPEYFCPYVEIFSDDESTVPVNPFLRFPEIFSPLFCNFITNTFKLDLVSFNNVLFHYLAQTDRSFGMNFFQMIIEKIRYELLHGYYGKKIINLWQGIESKDQEQILYVLAKKMLNGNMNYFSESVGRLFISHMLTYDRTDDVYFLYIKADNSDYNCLKLELLKFFFWFRNFKMIVVWKYPYGIIDIDSTMLIGYTQIV